MKRILFLAMLTHPTVKKETNVKLKITIGLTGMLLLASGIPGYATETLENDLVRAEFDDSGLVALHDKGLNKTLHFDSDYTSFIFDHNLISTQHLDVRDCVAEGDTVRFAFREGAVDIEVVYELRPEWRFISKQLFFTSNKVDVYTVRRVNVFQAQLANKPREVYVADYGEKVEKSKQLKALAGFTRMDKNWGGMFLVQNPFMDWQFDEGAISMDYRADMMWKQEWGRFASDRACIGLYELTGQMSPGLMTHRPPWTMEPEWALSEKRIDMGEIDAVINCVREFLLYKPVKSERIHVPWCENDYQIDVATAEGEAQFKRIVDACSAIGVEHMLYTVRNEEIALLEDATDNWNWEHLLWLNQGTQIRAGTWDPKTDTLPAKTRELMDYAESKNVKLMAYVYPTLEFEPVRDVLTTRAANNPQVVATFGEREFQDWFIENLIAFKERTGISGYSFDYWSMQLVGHSRYAQWWGGRRVLEELRKRAPDIIIDGRQQYHGYSPWIWLAGTYPHPTGGDEQPESFEAFPDLHFDRSSGTQQRLTSYWFRNIQFCPTELMPGFIGHQSPRKDATGFVDRLNDTIVRDWDYLGWRYSLISSVATAPFAHCVDMLPARDSREHELFMQDTDSLSFMRGWFDWTDENAKTLRNLRSIIGPPAIGRADGTAAFQGDRGFIFVFNPNHREVRAKFKLDASIGLYEGERFLIRHLYPEEGKYIGGVYQYGDAFSEMMPGTAAWVLEVVPETDVVAPILFNARGAAQLDKDTLTLSGVQGEIGARANLQVWLPASEKVKRVVLNGKTVSFEQHGQTVSMLGRFSGTFFTHNQAVAEYDPNFSGDTVSAVFSVPGRIFQQLAERKKKWSIDWTEEDLECTWLAPERLLLYLQIAEPDWKMEASMTLDGRPLEVKKAYSSRTPGMLRLDKGHNTFTGFYADVSGLKPGQEYALEVALPTGLKPGQFQGVFFENVETEYTGNVVVKAEGE